MSANSSESKYQRVLCCGLICFALSALISLGGCNNDGNDDDGDDPTEQATATPTVAPVPTLRTYARCNPTSNLCEATTCPDQMTCPPNACPTGVAIGASCGGLCGSMLSTSCVSPAELANCQSANPPPPLTVPCTPQDTARSCGEKVMSAGAKMLCNQACAPCAASRVHAVAVPIPETFVNLQGQTVNTNDSMSNSYNNSCIPFFDQELNNPPGVAALVDAAWVAKHFECWCL